MESSEVSCSLCGLSGPGKVLSLKVFEVFSKLVGVNFPTGNQSFCSFCVTIFGGIEKLLLKTQANSEELDSIATAVNPPDGNTNHQGSTYSRQRALSPKIQLESLIKKEKPVPEIRRTCFQNRGIDLQAQSWTPNPVNSKVRKIQRCGVCPRYFRTQHSFSSHSHKPDGSVVFKCKWCNSEFLKYEKFVQHGKFCNEGRRISQRTLHFGPKSCYFCKKQLPKGYSLRNHMARHTKEKPYYDCKVPNCQKRYLTSRRMKRHVILAHGGLDEIKQLQAKEAKRKIAIKEKNQANRKKCYFCYKTFLETGNLYKHIIRSHTMEGEKIECKICQKKFSARTTLRAHKMTICGNVDENIKQELLNQRRSNMENYLQKTQAQRTCYFCKVVFKAKHNLVGHISRHTKEVCLYTCFKCGAQFRSRTGFEQHKIMVCDQNKEKKEQFVKKYREKYERLKKTYPDSKVPCKKCGKQLRFRGLKNHEKNCVMSEAARKACYACNQIFSTYKEKTLHCKEAHGIRKVPQCYFCLKLFTNYSALKEHITLHTEERLWRHECGRNFRYCSNYMIHLKLCGEGKEYPDPSQEEGNQKAWCTLCKKWFRNLDAFKTHIHVSNGSVVYKCKWCGKKFAKYRGLRQHGKYCNKERRIRQRFLNPQASKTCYFCGEKLPKGAHIYRHMKQHTKEKE